MKTSPAKPSRPRGPEGLSAKQAALCDLQSEEDRERRAEEERLAEEEYEMRHTRRIVNRAFRAWYQSRFSCDPPEEYDPIISPS